MIEHGLIKEAFETCKGVVQSTYDVFGYHFQTPEAWDSEYCILSLHSFGSFVLC